MKVFKLRIGILKVGLIRIFFMITSLVVLTGCWSYREIETPGHIPGGYYNAYYNKNATILYKRPSAKFGCWRAPVGWECERH